VRQLPRIWTGLVPAAMSAHAPVGNISQTDQQLYFGTGGSANRVLATGDALFGTTVTKVSIGTKSLNHRQQSGVS